MKDKCVDARRSLEINILASVAGLFVIWPMLPKLALVFASVIMSEPSDMKKAFYWAVRLIDIGDLVYMVLWAALMFCLLRRSRWTLLFSGLLALLSALGLFHVSQISDTLWVNGVKPKILFMVLQYILIPIFVFSATFRLWRQGVFS